MRQPEAAGIPSPQPTTCQRSRLTAELGTRLNTVDDVQEGVRLDPHIAVSPRTLAKGLHRRRDTFENRTVCVEGRTCRPPAIPQVDMCAAGWGLDGDHRIGIGNPAQGCSGIGRREVEILGREGCCGYTRDERAKRQRAKGHFLSSRGPEIAGMVRYVEQRRKLDRRQEAGWRLARSGGRSGRPLAPVL